MQRLALHAALLFAAAAALPSHAIFRAYLSSTGSDANPCTIAAPCRLLPAALAVVDVGGEIWMLDSANYNTGPVTISTSVTIIGVPGELSSVVGLGGNAINVTGGAVVLRNLNVRWLSGGGVFGIVMSGGTRLSIENCVVNGFPASGILTQTAADVSISDTIARNNIHGMYLDGGATVQITRSQSIQNNIDGIVASGTGTTVHVIDSVASNNGDTGFWVQSGASNTRMSVTASIASNNGSYGFVAWLSSGQAGSGGRMSVIRSTAASNATSGFYNNGGVFESWGGNMVTGNGAQTIGTITPVTPL